MIARLIAWWRRRQRATDVAILWPICVEEAMTEDDARLAFACHAYLDPAWQGLSPREFDATIKALPYPQEKSR